MQGPHLVSWINYLKAGSACAILYCSAMGMLLVWQPGVAADIPAWNKNLTVVMLAGIVPAFLLGAFLSRAYLKYLTHSILTAFK